jgi:hypothetical protein
MMLDQSMSYSWRQVTTYHGKTMALLFDNVGLIVDMASYKKADGVYF